MKNILISSCRLFLIFNCFLPLSKADQDLNNENHLDLASPLTSGNSEWKVFMTHKNPGTSYQISISHNGASHVIAQVSKPICDVIFSKTSKYMVLVKKIGFCTMVDVFELDSETGNTKEIFSSEKSNKRPLVDYTFIGFDYIKNIATFKVYENPSYSEGRLKNRLLSEEYIYLDGNTLYANP